MIHDALDKYATKVGDTYVPKKTVGGSEIGQCCRKVWYRKSGQPADEGAPARWGAHIRGTVIEKEFWYKALKLKYGKRLVMAGPQQKSLVSGNLSATPDGLITGLRPGDMREYGVRDLKADCAVVECKTIDPRTHITEAKAQNKYQVQVQLGLIREKTRHKPRYALISYINASMWDDVVVYPEEFDPKVYQAAKDRAKVIGTARSASELRPEGWIGGGQECEWCPFVKPCGVVRRSVPEQDVAADRQFAAEITDACRDMKRLEAEAAAAEARVREAQQGIKDRMRERNVRKISGVVVWSAVKGRIIYDNVKLREAARAAGVDIEQFSTVGEPTDRLQVLVDTNSG